MAVRQAQKFSLPPVHHILLVHSAPFRLPNPLMQARINEEENFLSPAFHDRAEIHIRRTPALMSRALHPSDAFCRSSRSLQTLSTSYPAYRGGFLSLLMCDR